MQPQHCPKHLQASTCATTTTKKMQHTFDCDLYKSANNEDRIHELSCSQHWRALWFFALASWISSAWCRSFKGIWLGHHLPTLTFFITSSADPEEEASKVSDPVRGADTADRAAVLRGAGGWSDAHKRWPESCAALFCELYLWGLLCHSRADGLNTQTQQ